MLPIKKKDKVLVITGDDKGKKGEVLKVVPQEQKIIVSKVNIVKKHTRPTQTAPGGIREIEAPIHLSNVMLLCPKCDQPTRPKFDFLADGKKVRFCRKCGEMIM
ncbi:MAG TPA: 50S ribosomal protein L24 [Elusimicrobia bacterium]|jgi:large subunit ribosomal protein L24|nr:50S ribosomal protein L24 [Elusimicrobiota bacterium]